MTFLHAKRVRGVVSDFGHSPRRGPSEERTEQPHVDLNAPHMTDAALSSMHERSTFAKLLDVWNGGSIEGMTRLWV